MCSTNQQSCNENAAGSEKQVQKDDNNTTILLQKALILIDDWYIPRTIGPRININCSMTVNFIWERSYKIAIKKCAKSEKNALKVGSSPVTIVILKPGR
uniref:SCP domain-containing protein n=1 Tax=Panagrellus redivivus TaxID=6233 RepID=A0A7E4VR53_PANRE